MAEPQTTFTIWHAFAIATGIVALLISAIGVLAAQVFGSIKEEIKEISKSLRENITLIHTLMAKLPDEYIRRQQFVDLSSEVKGLSREVIDVSKEISEFRSQATRDFDRIFKHIDGNNVQIG